MISKYPDELRLKTGPGDEEDEETQSEETATEE